MSELSAPVGPAPPPSTGTEPPPTGGSQPTVQGDTPYPATGAANELDDQGSGTRHYASGAPDDVTHEWEGSTNAQSYMIVIDITLTEIDHDDTISLKFGGTHNGTGWYDNGYGFESGQACIGKEENHPDTDLCEVTGTSIGNLVNKRVKLAAVNFNKGEKIEGWSNSGSGWQKDVETGPGVTGFRPESDEDEIQIRIDAAPGIDMHSAAWYEIGGTGTATGGAPVTEAPGTEGEEGGGEEDEDEDDEGNIARVLTARRSRKMLRASMSRRTYRSRRTEDGEFFNPLGFKVKSSSRFKKIGGL